MSPFAAATVTISGTKGRALQKEFGITASVGRHSGYEFLVLRQVHGTCEADMFCEWIHKVAEGIHEVDGVPVTLYLSIGSAVYSACRDLEEQAKLARPEE